MTDKRPGVLERLSLRGKFSLPIAILIVAMVIGLGLGVFVKRWTDQFLLETQTFYLPRLELAAEARNSFAAAKLHAVHYFLATSPTQRDLDRNSLQQELATTDLLLRKLLEHGGSSAVIDLTTEIRRQINDDRRLNLEGVAAESGAGYGPGELADLYVARNDVSPMLERLVIDVRMEFASAQKQAEAFRTNAVRLVGGLGVLALLGSVLTMRWVLRTHLAAPLQRLHGRMVEIASHSVEDLAAEKDLAIHPSLTAPVPDLGRHDQLGAMAEAVDLLRQDKTFAVQLLRRLETARGELTEQAKMASLGTIVAGVAHEINTPIGICVTGSSGIIEEIEELLEAQKRGPIDSVFLEESLSRINDYAALVLANMTRAGALVASFKQISVDQTADVVRRFELGAYTRQIVETLRPELMKFKVAVVVDCPKPIEITIRPSAMWQILSNLILNATRHAFGNEELVETSPQIRIALRRSEGRISLEVADNGAGMPDDVRRHVFDPFFTTRRGDGGSGLGLTIVYNLVTRTMNGAVVCHSQPGAGARFVITFPEMQLTAPAPI